MTSTPGPGERVEEIRRTFRQHFEEGGHCDGVCEIEGHGWVRSLLAHIATLDTALAASRADNEHLKRAEQLSYDRWIAMEEKLRDAERVADLMRREGLAHHQERMKLREEKWAAEQRVAGLQAAVDGTHFHHKAFEPLCNHCRVVEATLLTPPPVAPGPKS